MSKLDFKEQHAADRARFTARVPVAIARDVGRDAADDRTLYVLEFGIAGAIITNALVFSYFASFYASG